MGNILVPGQDVSGTVSYTVNGGAPISIDLVITNSMVGVVDANDLEACATGGSASAGVCEMMAKMNADADPFADPLLADIVAKKLLVGADHAWELAEPPGFDPIDAAERFMHLAQAVQQVVGEECELELWPAIRGATFHGEIVLPASVMAEPTSAVVRASNFANLIAVLNDDRAVRPEILAQLRRRFDRAGYRFIPALPLRREYTGHHRGMGQFSRWSDRLFGYV